MYRYRGLGAAPSVQQIAQAIATAEGYLLPSGQINAPNVAPVRNNNPCDLVSGGSLAQYGSIDQGWSACYNQIGLILNDQSSVYSSDMSISDIASHWAPAPSSSCGAMCAGNVPSNWAATVAAQLGLSPSDTLTGDSSTSASTIFGPTPDQLAGGSVSPASDASAASGIDLSSLTSQLSSTGVDFSNPWVIAGIAAFGIGLLAWARA